MNNWGKILYLATQKQRPFSLKHHKKLMFVLGNISASTYVYEINHTNFKVISISVINCSQ